MAFSFWYSALLGLWAKYIFRCGKQLTLQDLRFWRRCC